MLQVLSTPVGMRGALTSWSLMTSEERILKRDAEILSEGKIAESPKFWGKKA